LVVLARFRQRSAIRTLVALAAGYAFALQLLLAGILVTQMTVGSSTDPFVICASDAASPDGSHGNGSHAAHQACTICAFASSASLPLIVGHPIALAIEAAALLRPTTASLTVAGRWHSPRLSQGPPRHV
jgi:hypothetical protein